MQAAAFWPLIGAAVVLALLLVTRLVRRQRRRRRPHPHHAYQAAIAVRPSEAKVGQYLQRAFPECLVLLHAPLERLLAPRSVEHREAARAAIAGLGVDFAVCADHGKPIFAFDLAEAAALRDAAAEQQKNRALKSAGVRLVRLKGTPEQWPDLADFRLRLAVAALRPASDAALDAAETIAPAGGQPRSAPAAAAPESSIMGMTVLLMDPEEAEAAWRAARE